MSPTYSTVGESTIVTNIGGASSGSNVANLIGADRFYGAGYTGAGTRTANIEAGHIWSGHETLGHVTQFSNSIGASGDFDRHATWVGQTIGGRGPNSLRQGIAPQTSLRSGAIATRWTGSPYSLGFRIDASSFYAPYTSASTGFGNVDVINSS